MKLILTIFKWGAAILCCFLILITVVVAANYAFKLYENDSKSYITVKDDKMRHELVKTAKTETGSFIYKADKTVRYKEDRPTYSVDIRPNTTIGYYYMASTLIFLTLGVLILWTFWKIFAQISLDAPFRNRVVRHLYIVAYLFIISDVLGVIHYYILDRFIYSSIQAGGLHQISDIGSSLLIGLMILIIAVVYKRGLEIYEENSLTV